MDGDGVNVLRFQFEPKRETGLINLYDILEEEISVSKRQIQSPSIWCTF